MSSLDRYAAATAAANTAYDPSVEQAARLETAVHDAANTAHDDGYSYQDLAGVYVSVADGGAA
jgi:hypothetical protein